jgi:hypothetical protein
LETASARGTIQRRQVIRAHLLARQLAWFLQLVADPAPSRKEFAAAIAVIDLVLGEDEDVAVARRAVVTGQTPTPTGRHGSRRSGTVQLSDDEALDDPKVQHTPLGLTRATN